MMLGYAPSRPLGALPDPGLGTVVIESFAEIEAAFDNPALSDLLGDPNVQPIFSAEITLNEIGTGGSSVLIVATEFMTTLSSDTPANTPIDGFLEGGLRIDQSVIGSDGFNGFAQNISELTITASEGGYDTTFDANSINGQSIVCKVGARNTDGSIPAYSEFETVASLIGERWRLTRATLTIETRDVAALLDVPVQSSVYLGTGGLEGDAEIAGKRRPMGDGPVFNATPVTVLAARGFYQASTTAHGAINITAVKDGGLNYTFIADYASSALLLAAEAANAFPPSYYGTCNAEGYLVAGGDQVGQITVDFTGPNLTTADIIEAAALNSAGLTAAQIDSHTFDRVNTAQPATIHYFLGPDSSETCREMFGKLMKGIHGFASMSPRGALQIGVIEPPGTIAAHYFDVKDGSLVDIDRTDLPQGVDPPPSRWNVICARNWTVLNTVYGEVAESDPALADYLTKPHKIAATSDEQAAAILADYPGAKESAPQECWFADPADGAAHAQFLYSFYTAGYRPYRSVVKNALTTLHVGAVINVKDSTDAPRFNLDTARYLRLVQAVDDMRTLETEVIGIG